MSQRNLKDCSDSTKEWYITNCRPWLNSWSKENKISFAIAQRHILFLVDEGYKKFETVDSVKDFLIIRKNIKKPLDQFIHSYGKSEGMRRYEESCQNKSIGISKDAYVKKNGIDKWNDLCKSRSHNLEFFINKYGQTEGKERYSQLVENSKSTKENFIKRYGQIEGTKRYEESCRRKSYSNTYESYIDKYGDDADSKWCDVISRKTSNVNTVSKQEKYVFDILDKHIEDGKRQYKIGVYKVDYVNLKYRFAIEYNGSPFHANPLRYSKDDFPCPFRKHLTSEQIWQYDKKKSDTIIESGEIDMIFYIWDTDNIEEKIAEIIKWKKSAF